MLEEGMKESISSKGSLSPNKCKRKICFFLSNVNTPYEGVARVFINWGFKLLDYDNEVCFILLKCNKTLRQLIENKNANITVIEIKNLRELQNYIQYLNPEVIITDDEFHRLRLISKIKSRTEIKTCIYCQVLYGIHSVVDVFDLRHICLKDRGGYQMSRLIPFTLLKKLYKKLLLRQDIVLANSQTTATLLHILYGVEPDEIIYPPIDTMEFKPSETVEQTTEILVYLGSHDGDTNEDFVRKICKTLQDVKCKILVFGNKRLQEKVKNEFNIDGVFDVSDQTLAKIYSQCKLTICPQKWEMFGYVPAESISCGTPVLAFNLMGPSEIINETKMGILANNEKEFLRKIKDFNFEKIKENKVEKYSPWDMDYSSKKLNDAITASE